MRPSAETPRILELAPLLPVASGLIAGIAVQSYATPPLAAHWLALAPATALALIGSLRRRCAPLLVFIAAVSVGAMVWHASQIVPTSSVERFAGDHGPPCRLRGIIVREQRMHDPPPNPFEQWIPRGERTSFVLHVHGIEMPSGFVPATGKVWATSYEALLNIGAGSEVEVFGQLHPLRPPQNPGSFDWAAFARAQGIVARIQCQHRDAIVALSTSAPTRAWLDWYRSTVAKLLTDHLPPSDEEATLLQSMLLGQRSALAERLNAIFIDAGCIHFLAVSGVNVAIVMGLAYGLCRLIGLRRHACTLVMIVAIVAYTLLAEPRPPILRAAIIGLMYCAARLLGRDSSNLNWVAAAAILLLLANPLSLFDVGFQLSFVAVLGVSYLAPALRHAAHEGLTRVRSRGGVSAAESDSEIIKRVRRLQRRKIKSSGVFAAVRWCARRSLDGLIIGIAAWLAALPIVAFHFFRFQPWGAVNSVIIAPFVTSIMGLGFAKVLLSLISPTLAAFVASILSALDAAMMRIVEWMAVLPGASFWTTPPSAASIILFYILVVAFVLRFSYRPRPIHATGEDRNDAPPRAVSLLPRYTTRATFILALIAGPAWAWFAREIPALRVTVLAVGRGSTTVIELPDGQTILYDVGSSYASDVSETVLLPFLRSQGIRHVDRIYISHPNLDHFSGLPGLLNELPSSPVIINDLFDEKSRASSPSRHLLDLLALGGHELDFIGPSSIAGTITRAPPTSVGAEVGARYGPSARIGSEVDSESASTPSAADSTRWTFGGADFELLSPLPGDAFSTANDTSTVMRITYAGRSILLTGDIDEGAQRTLLARGSLHADVLLLPHHGSVRSTTRQFLQAVNADFLIRSSNERMDDTINGLQQIVADGILYNTADDGAVTITFDKVGVTISPHLIQQ